MSTYTIKTVGEPREWRSEKFGGTFLAYPVDLTDEEGNVHIGVEWSRKPESRKPEAGEQIVGHIQGGPHGDKLKVDFNATKELGSPRPSTGSSGGGNYGSKREWKPEGQFDPEKVARITRAHSQNAAVALLSQNPEFHTKPKENRLEAIKWWTAQFEADIQQAAANALAKSSLGAETPALRPAAADGEIVDDKGIPFARPEYPALFSERERRSNRP